MDIIYTTFKDILDGLIPSANLAQFQGLNDLLAYLLTVIIVWGALLRPLLKLARIIK